MDPLFIGTRSFFHYCRTIYIVEFILRHINVVVHTLVQAVTSLADRCLVSQLTKKKTLIFYIKKHTILENKLNNYLSN